MPPAMYTPPRAPCASARSPATAPNMAQNMVSAARQPTSPLAAPAVISRGLERPRFAPGNLLERTVQILEPAAPRGCARRRPGRSARAVPAARPLRRHRPAQSPCGRLRSPSARPGRRRGRDTTRRTRSRDPGSVIVPPARPGMSGPTARKSLGCRTSAANASAAKSFTRSARSKPNLRSSRSEMSHPRLVKRAEPSVTGPATAMAAARGRDCRPSRSK